MNVARVPLAVEVFEAFEGLKGTGRPKATKQASRGVRNDSLTMKESAKTRLVKDYAESSCLDSVESSFDMSEEVSPSVACLRLDAGTDALTAPWCFLRPARARTLSSACLRDSIQRRRV